MATALLILIYICFISLGLPDTLFGSAWPIIRYDLGLPLDMGGIISLIVTAGTIASSLMASRILRRFGVWSVVTASVAMTGLAMLGYALSKGVGVFFLLTVPLGIGAGAIDATLNNFVALHYKARHMNWLHCFWGVGAVTGPMIMSAFIALDGKWRMGYLTVAIIQLCICIVVAISVPLWRRVEKSEQAIQAKEARLIGNIEAIKIPGVKLALGGFFAYCAAECAVGLWSSSYFVEARNVPKDQAAAFTSLFYLGLTAGRFIAGLISSRLSSSAMVRWGMGFCATGIFMVLLPLNIYVAAVGLLIFGIGSGPVYPAMIHETPARFTAEASQTVIGLQMAVAYTGSALIPPIIGFVSSATTIRIFPYFLAISIVVIVICLEELNRGVRVRANKPQSRRE